MFIDDVHRCANREKKKKSIFPIVDDPGVEVDDTNVVINAETALDQWSEGSKEGAKLIHDIFYPGKTEEQKTVCTEASVKATQISHMSGKEVAELAVSSAVADDSMRVDASTPDDGAELAVSSAVADDSMRVDESTPDDGAELAVSSAVEDDSMRVDESTLDDGAGSAAAADDRKKHGVAYCFVDGTWVPIRDVLWDLLRNKEFDKVDCGKLLVSLVFACV